MVFPLFSLAVGAEITGLRRASHVLVLCGKRGVPRVGTDASVLPLWYASLPGNLESLLNGVTPDPIRDGDALSRLKLAQALQRATYAIAWERAWPNLARLLTVVGLFLVVSWAGLWLALPSIARAIGLVFFAGVAIAVLFPMSRFRWPSREEALARLDRGSGIRHRPATTLTDTLSSQDPVAQALWRAQRERTLASIKRIRAGLPKPRLALHDPWELRALVMVMLVATFFAAGDARAMRLPAPPPRDAAP